MSSITPSLIQRATHKRNGPSLDAAFDFHYMGSSEFEFGTLPRSIRALRLWDQGTPLILEKQVAGTGEAIWYVGPEGRKGTALLTFEEDLESRFSRGRQEATGIQAMYRGADFTYGDPDTWLAVSDRLEREARAHPDEGSMPFAMFRKNKAAQTFLKLLRARRV